MMNPPELPFLGHEKVWERFRKSYCNDRLASTYLFVGRAGIGKRTVAVQLAKTLLCDNLSAEFSACDHCPSCKLVNAGNHPDLISIAKPEGKNFIPLESLIGDREHRRRAGLCHDISLTPFYGRRKVAIIDDADFLNVEGANCLLKTLEEPPESSILILISTSEHRQLPTILSRSQIVRFQDLAREQIAKILTAQSLVGDVEQERLVDAANGSVEVALKLDDQELFEFRTQLLSQLGTADPADNHFSKDICDFVDGRYKEAAARRDEYTMLADMAIHFFDAVMRVAAGADPIGIPSETKTALDNFLNATGHIAEIAADCIERTEQFKKHIAANLAAANVVPAWLNDLGALARQEKTLVTSW